MAAPNGEILYKIYNFLVNFPNFFSNDVKVSANMCVKFGLNPMSKFGFF